MKKSPELQETSAVKKVKKSKYLIGIDEAGRGPIAGPISVGAFVFLTAHAHTMFRGVKECKQLPEEKREKWFGKIEKAKKDGHINYSVCMESEKVIDKKGLTFCIKRALAKNLKKLKLNPEECEVLLDGGLRAPKQYKNQKTIIKGDEKKKVIALASICAKVLRDRIMHAHSKTYPGYGFEANKGYGTEFHYAALKKHGILPIHRRRFLRDLKAIKVI